jgi:hypothetical protein
LRRIYVDSLCGEASEDDSELLGYLPELREVYGGEEQGPSG